MDNQKVGATIKKARTEKGITQKALGDLIRVSDKAVSKWERGLGCPDISLLNELSEILGIDTKSLLEGEIIENDFVGGNMKHIKFYICPVCQNITFSTGQAQSVCCGKPLVYTAPQKPEENMIKIENVEDQLFITSTHPMDKENYISFVAVVTGDRLEVIKQYPQWDLQVRVAKKIGATLVWYSTTKGLYSMPLKANS